MGNKTLAVVIPIYNEQENLPELFRRLREVFAGLQGIDTQVIYVNDGSQDRSLAIMVEQNKQDPRFTLVELSRNFGHQSALAAGLTFARAEAVVLMDGDLQDPPEVIPDLVACWQAGAHVVRAERRSRAERGLRRLGFELFHRFFSYISDFPIPGGAGIFGLLDRQAYQEILQLPEKNRFFPGLRSWIGFDQRTVLYDRQDRAAGEPKQTLRRLVRYAMDGVFSFSYKPLRLMMWMGLIICVTGFFLACFFILQRLFHIPPETPTGFPTLATLVLFLGGVQLVAIGLLGEYLGRIYDEVKQRPLFIVRRTYGLENPENLKG
jgi:glycosyltransferase involved in cell wall biosynthesis